MPLDSVSHQKMPSIVASYVPYPLFLLSIIIFRGSLSLNTNESRFEITLHRPSNPRDRMTIYFAVTSHSIATALSNVSPSVQVIMCSPLEPNGVLDRPTDRTLTKFESFLQVSHIRCRNGFVPPDVLQSKSNTSLIVYVPRPETGIGQSINGSYIATVIKHSVNQIVMRLDLGMKDNLYRWLISSQPIYARLSRVERKTNGTDWALSTRTRNSSVASRLEQLSASQTHVDRNHVTTVMIYVLLTFFTLFVLTGILGLVGYLIQRLRHVHIKRRCSRHLILATRKAMKKLPLRTLRPSDIEVSSGYDQCAVCIELYKASDVIRILPCRHFYHKKCIDPWLLEQRSCPLCKLDILKSCGIRLGLSPEDESYLATRLVERDTDSVSSSSSYASYAISRVSYPTWWRIKRFFASILGKSTDSECDACSLAYPQVIPLDTLGYEVPSHYPAVALHSLFNAHEAAEDYRHILTYASASVRQNQACSTSIESERSSFNCFMSCIYPCLCWWRRDSAATCDSGLDSIRDLADHGFNPDQDTTRALHGARLLWYRNCQSTDRLCYYHASAMGIPNVYRTPHSLHWTRYVSHCAALQRHWNDLRSSHTPVSSTHSRWRQLFGLKQCSAVTSHVSEGIEKRSDRSMESCEPTRQPASDEKRQVSQPELLIPDQMEHAAVIHQTTDDGTRNSAQVSPTGTVKVDSDKHDTPPRVSKLDECHRLSALPPISVTGTHSSSSSDGSSEPSLVILPPTSIPGYVNTFDHFWSPWYGSTTQIPPPTYLESLSQNWNSIMIRPDRTEHIQPQCKMRSRKFRAGYHPYLYPPTGHRRPVNDFTDFNCQMNRSVLREEQKVCRERIWHAPFMHSVIRSERFLNSLSRLFCASRSSESSSTRVATQTDPIKRRLCNPPNNPPPPPYCQRSELATHCVTISQNSTPPIHEPSISWPHTNITCPWCRVELRQVAHRLHEHGRIGSGWRRVFNPHHSFKRTGTNSQWFNPCDSFGRKLRHSHHHHHQHSQLPQERKPSSTLRTAVHVHSYELRNPQPSHSDSSESAVASRVQGVRVTVEPPEVQYHNGPSTSDSGSSPVASDLGEGSSGSDMSQPDVDHHLSTK